MDPEEAILKVSGPSGNTANLYSPCFRKQNIGRMLSGFWSYCQVGQPSERYQAVPLGTSLKALDQQEPSSWSRVGQLEEWGRQKLSRAVQLRTSFKLAPS
jgi:hypothetical protein